MMIKKIHYIIFLFCFCLSKPLAAQDGITSSQQWFSFDVSKKFDDLKVTLEEGWRIQEMYISLNNYTDLGIDYKINKFLKAGAGYRFIQQGSLFNIENLDHRFTADVTVKYELEPVAFSYKTRLQTRVRGGVAPGLDGRSKSYNRNEFGVSFDAGDIALKFSWESYLRLSMSEKFIDQHRFQFGGEYNINKNNTIGLFYLLQKEVNIYEPWTIHTLGLSYSLEL